MERITPLAGRTEPPTSAVVDVFIETLAMFVCDGYKRDSVAIIFSPVLSERLC